MRYSRRYRKQKQKHPRTLAEQTSAFENRNDLYGRILCTSSVPNLLCVAQ